MHRTASFRRHRRAPCHGFAAVIPLAIAAFLSLMLVTASHSTPSQLAQAPGASRAGAIVVAEASAGVAPVPLASMFFDEHFYTPPVDDREDEDVASN